MKFLHKHYGLMLKSVEYTFWHIHTKNAVF